MKRPTLATRYANANKAQENPYGILIAGLLFVIVVVLSLWGLNERWVFIARSAHTHHLILADETTLWWFLLHGTDNHLVQ